MFNKNVNRQTSRAIRKIKAEEGAHGIAMTEEQIAEAEEKKREIEKELRQLKADKKTLKAEVKAAKGHVKRKAQSAVSRKPSHTGTLASTSQGPNSSPVTSTPPMPPTSSFGSSSHPSHFISPIMTQGSANHLLNTEPQPYAAFPSPSTSAYPGPHYAPSPSFPYENYVAPSSQYVSSDPASDPDAFSALGEITFN